MDEPASSGLYIGSVPLLSHPIELVRTGTPGFKRPPEGGFPLFEGIKLIPFFPAEQNQVFGVSPGSRKQEWQYIDVRRVAILIELALRQRLQWVVAENNGPALWSRLKLRIQVLLKTLWLSGELQGSKPDEAYFVRCDEYTMTQEDIDSGRVVALLGFAPLYPAEFVLLQITAFARRPLAPPEEET